jgi:glycosyltransferase involved in cell wall biosynthesis
MRIVMLGQKGIPAREGGVERHVEELAARLVALGHAVTVYVRMPYVPRTMRTHRGVRLVHLPTVRTKHLEAIIHSFLATLHVLATKPDVVHYHGVGPAALLWIPRMFLHRTKVVFTFHCQDYHHQKWNFLARLFLRAGEYIGVRCADEVITVSKTLTRYVATAYLRRATYIPNGVVKTRSHESRKTLRRFGLRPRQYVLAVARLVRHKGIHELIAASTRLATTHDLVIAGDGA